MYSELIMKVGNNLSELINFQFGIKLIRKLMNEHVGLRPFVTDPYILDKVRNEVPSKKPDKKKVDEKKRKIRKK